MSRTYQLLAAEPHVDESLAAQQRAGRVGLGPVMALVAVDLDLEP
ncbi:hypothetical protein [Reyranella aquatilis]|nr:hypothetical protein [Reyranella aquatilis]